MYFCDKPNLSYLGAPRWHTLPSLLSELDVGMCRPFPPSANTLCFHKKYASVYDKLCKRGQVWTSGTRPWSNETEHVHTSQRVGHTKYCGYILTLGPFFLIFCVGPGSNIPQEEHKYFWRFQWEAESNSKPLSTIEIQRLSERGCILWRS